MSPRPPPSSVTRAVAILLALGPFLGCANVVLIPFESTSSETSSATSRTTTAETANALSSPRPTAEGTKGGFSAPERPERTEEPVGAEQATSPRDESYRLPLPTDLTAMVAAPISTLTDQQCKASIAAAQIPVTWVTSGASGVALPVKLTGPIHTVRFEVADGPLGIMDCRLAVLLDAYAEFLVEQGIARVVVDNYFRKGAKIGGGKKRSQHASGLAIDIVKFVRSDGAELTPARWGAAKGELPCGPDAVGAAEPATRNLVCETARRGYFHTVLTPSFDAAHASHFHFDLRVEKPFYRSVR